MCCFLLNNIFGIKKFRSFQFKRNKFLFYLMGYWRIVVPNCIFRWMLPHYIKKAQKLDRECLDRVSYYNKLQSQYEFDRRHLSLIKYTIKIKPKAYFFDVYRLIRYFSNRYKIWPLFGDIIGIPEAPAIVKSRPISDNNMNSVLLKLNSIRHFLFIKDPFDFYAKKDKLVWRGNIQSNQTRITSYNVCYTKLLRKGKF